MPLWSESFSAPVGPSGERIGAGVATANGLVYFIGGSVGGVATAEVDSFNPATHTGTSALAPLPVAASGLFAVEINGLIYVTGDNLAGVYRYNPTTDSWSVGSTAATGYSNCVESGGIIYGLQSSTFAKYDPATDTWTTLAAPWASGGLIAAVNGIVYAALWTGSDYSQTAAYDTSGNAWSAVAVNAGVHAYPPIGCARDGSMYALVYDGTWQSVYSYDPTSDAWSTFDQFVSQTQFAQPGYATDGETFYILGGKSDGTTHFVQFDIGAPYAASGLGPSGTVVDGSQTTRLSWTFTDPDAGDTQSKFDLSYKRHDLGAWTTVSRSTANTYYDMPANTFTAGYQWDWQVTLYDSAGHKGPVSSTATFTAGAAAPTPLTPVDGSTVDRNQTQRFSWQFNDSASTQASFTLEYRIVGDSTWITVTGTTDTFVDVAAGTLSEADYEWQVQTVSADGATSSWSALSTFTAASGPSTPAWTSPADGSTIRTTTATFTFTVSGSIDSGEWRRVADDGAGNPVPSTVYLSGTGGASDRSFVITFDNASRTEHVQLRAWKNGFASSWVDSTHPVGYYAPTVACTPGTDEITVAITPQDPPTTGNRLTSDQATFEGSALTWQSTGGIGNVSLSKDVAAEGSKSLKANSTAQVEVTVPRGPLTAGTQYTGLLSLYTTDAGVSLALAAMEFFDAAGNSLGRFGGTATAPTAGAWNLRTVTATAPAGAVDVKLYAQVNQPAVFYVDKASFAEGTSTTWTAPNGGVFTTVSVDLFRRILGKPETTERIAAGLTPDASVTDDTPGSGTVYQFMARAYRSDGSTIDSLWTP